MRHFIKKYPQKSVLRMLRKNQIYKKGPYIGVCMYESDMNSSKDYNSRIPRPIELKIRRQCVRPISLIEV